MPDNARQISLQEANAQYRKEEADRRQLRETDQNRIQQAIETAFGKSASRPRRVHAPAGSQRKTQP